AVGRYGGTCGEGPFGGVAHLVAHIPSAQVNGCRCGIVQFHPVLALTEAIGQPRPVRCVHLVDDHLGRGRNAEHHGKEEWQFDHLVQEVEKLEDPTCASHCPLTYCAPVPVPGSIGASPVASGSAAQGSFGRLPPNPLARSVIEVLAVPRALDRSRTSKHQYGPRWQWCCPPQAVRCPLPETPAVPEAPDPWVQRPCTVWDPAPIRR